jgi:hypothetical protein
MSQNPQYGITNEQLLLIDILNGIYNDNIRQVNRFTDYIQTLHDSNMQIRNTLVQILNNSNNSNNFNNRRGNSRYNQRNSLRDLSSTYSNASANNTTNTNTNTGLGRVYLNNRPYIIDSFQHYNIPLNGENIDDNNNLSQLLQNFFQPVEVFPTQTQIETATRRVRYCDIISPRNRSCPISLENFNDTDLVSVIRFCGHIFNAEQLTTWFMSNCRCPVCRYDIRRYNANASSEFFNTTETTPEPSSTPLNQSENVSPILNEERNATQGRTNNVLSVFNSILDNFNDTNYLSLQDLDAIGNVITDLSGNNTSEVMLTLLNSFTNRANR